MPYVSDSIGTKFERVVQERFSELGRSQGGNLPDFYHSNGFYVEAKVGNIEWGPRVKTYQIDDFRGISEPVVYAMGFHNFDYAIRKLSGKPEPERQRTLDREFNVLEVLFISNNLVEKIWKKENRFSKEGPTEYCMFKHSLANALFKGTFRRFGKKEKPKTYYGFSPKEYYFFKHDYKGITWRAVLHKRKDRKVINFLRKAGIWDASGVIVQ